MKTKKDLQPSKSGYLGLRDAQEQTNRIFRNMRMTTPIQYQVTESETTTTTIYQGNGIRATVIVEKGGVR